MENHDQVGLKAEMSKSIILKKKIIMVHLIAMGLNLSRKGCITTASVV
jgi:hypothetical protein